MCLRGSSWILALAVKTIQEQQRRIEVLENAAVLKQ